MARGAGRLYGAVLFCRWSSVWLEVLGGFMVLFCGLFAVITRETISGGIVGLTISYALQVGGQRAFYKNSTNDSSSFP